VQKGFRNADARDGTWDWTLALNQGIRSQTRRLVPIDGVRIADRIGVRQMLELFELGFRGNNHKGPKGGDWI